MSYLPRKRRSISAVQKAKWRKQRSTWEAGTPHAFTSVPESTSVPLNNPESIGWSQKQRRTINSTRRATQRATTRDQDFRRIHIPNNNITVEELQRRLEEAVSHERNNRNHNNGRYFDANNPGNYRRHPQGGGGNNGGEGAGGGGGGGDGGSNGGDSFFNDLIKSPTKATLLFYVNSGFLRFQQYKDFNKRWDGQEVDVEALLQEIKEEELLDDELQELASLFLMCHSFTQSDSPACACCGLRQSEKPADPVIHYERVPLSDPKMSPIQYTETETLDHLQTANQTIQVPINDAWDIEEVYIWQCKSVFCQKTNDLNGVAEHTQYWHLHPELVDQDETECLSTLVCPDCWLSLSKREPVRPELSIAKGIDFGFFARVKGLVEPTFFEKMIIARTRLFFATMKVTSNERGVTNRDYRHKMKCHAVLFPHNAPEVASYMYNSDIFGKDGILDLNALKGLLQIYLVDHKGNQDTLAETIFGTSAMTARPYVIAQWLMILQRIHKHYADLHVESITRLRESVELITNLQNHLKTSATSVSDAENIHREDTMGSDVAHIQNVEMSTEARRRIAEEEEAIAGDDTELPISFSYVTNTTEAYLTEDSNDIRFKALQNFADLEEHEVQHVLNQPGTVENMLYDPSGLDEWLTKFPPTHTSSASRSEFPYSDFHDSTDRALTTSFPHIFMLGKAYGRSPGRLNLKQRVHLLNQFTLVPSQDRCLVGFLNDVLTRTAVFDGIKAYVEGNPTSVQAIRDLLEDIEKRAALKAALAFPYSESSKQLISKYMKHFRFAGKNVEYGPVQGANTKQKIVAYTKRYGASSVFLTFSPDNLSNPRALRLTFRMENNNKFPVTFEEGCSRGHNGTEFLQNITDLPVLSEGIINLPKSERAQRSINNPVAFVTENKQLIHDILTILFGVNIENRGFYARTDGVSSRRTRYYRSKKGMFGYAIYLLAVTESHDKGTLHWHANLLAGPSPQLMQRFSSLPEICTQIAAVLDSIYRATLEPSVHSSLYVKRYLRQQHYQFPSLIPKNVVECLKQNNALTSRAVQFHALENGEPTELTHQSITMLVEHQVGQQNHHLHLATCHKGMRGNEGCRLDYEQPCIGRTEPVRLILNQNPNEEDDETDSQQSYQIVPIRPSPYIPQEDHSRKHHMQSILHWERETSLVIWELRRPDIDIQNVLDLKNLPQNREHLRTFIIQTLYQLLATEIPTIGPTETFWNWVNEEAATSQLKDIYDDLRKNLPCANGCVVAFCPLLSYCTGSHNNSSFMGSAGQAKAAMFYLIPYETKAKFPLHQSLSIIHASAIHVFTHASTAPDTGTIQRTVKHFLTRAMNRMHLLMEISDWEMAAALIGLPSLIESDNTVLTNPMTIASFRTAMEMEEDTRASLEALNDRLSTSQTAATTLALLPVRRNRKGPSGRQNHHRTRICELQSNPLRKIPVDALRHIVRFLCEDPTDGNREIPIIVESLKKNYRHNLVKGLFTSDPWLYHNTLKDDVCISSIIDFAFDRYEEMVRSIPAYDHSSAREKLGYIRKVKVGDPDSVTNPVRKLLIPSSAEYYFRGPNLEDLTYYEYMACFAFKNISPSDKPDDPLNFKAATQFKMDQRYPAHTNCHHVIRRKQYTPVMVGDIPSYPGLEPNSTDTDTHARWQLKADRYAQYFLAAFRPLSVRNNPLDNWQGLHDWIAHLSRPEETSVISTFRLMMMQQHMKGMYFPEKLTTAARNYRARARHMWTQEEKNEFNRKASLERFNVEFNNRRTTRVADMAERIVSEKTKKVMFAQLQFDKEQSTFFNKLTFATNNQQNQQTTRPSQWQSMLNSTPPLKELQSTLSKMQSWKASHFPTRPTNASNLGNSSSAFFSQDNTPTEAMVQTIRERMQLPDSNQETQQLSLFREYEGHLAHTNPMMPQVVLLQGNAGVGKTTCKNAISDLYQLYRNYLMNMSFNGNVAAAMPGGKTVCKWIGNKPAIHMHFIGSFAPEIVQELRQNNFNEHSLVVIEEFETCALWHIARVTKLCELANNDTRLFGGASTLLIGDVGQLGPVRAGPSITQLIMEKYQDEELRNMRLSGHKRRKRDAVTTTSTVHDTTHPNNVGMEVFMRARLYTLTQQQRSVDPIHSSLFEKFRNYERITMADLKEREYRIFDEEDAKSGLWDEASVVTCTNRTRYTFTHLTAIRFGKHYNYPIIRWRSNWQNWTNMPDLTYLAQASRDPCFHEYFVKGCGGFLDEKYMDELQLINGILVIYHSLRFDPENEREAKIILQNAPPGEITDLPFPPLMIIVDVQLPAGVAEDIKNALQSYSLTHNETNTTSASTPTIRIAIQRTTCKWSENPVPVHGGDNYEPSWVQIQALFPLQTNFSITAHKSLGQTLERIIIPLSCNPNFKYNFSYKQLNVVLTRVRRRADVRLLLLGNNEAEQWNSISYIDFLKPDPSEVFYLCGFRDLNGSNPNENWKTNEWCPERANQVFKEKIRNKEIEF
jgi:hypothetical protein